eukprot:scaffold4757_cov93-Skeletonema_dohrnii-CCMP3373.AAC.3
MHLCVKKLRTSCTDADSISSSFVLSLSLSSEMLLSLIIASLKWYSGSWWFDSVDGEKGLGSIGEKKADEHGNDIQKVVMMMCANAKLHAKKFMMAAPRSSSLDDRNPPPPFIAAPATTIYFHAFVQTLSSDG